jgi:hypothetical protein
MCDGEDGDVAQAKLDGSWPGWEELSKFKPGQSVVVDKTK